MSQRRPIKQIVNKAAAQPAYITSLNRQSLAPFVLFDAGRLNEAKPLNIDWHPHSGVATVTLPCSGTLHHRDSMGNAGEIKQDGLQFMASGKGIWHQESYTPNDQKPLGIVQMWLTLPPNEENTNHSYFNLEPKQIPQHGNTRVLLGNYQCLQSPAEISHDVTYLDVTLPADDSWQFLPPESQTRGFIYVLEGSVEVNQSTIETEQFVQFEESNGVIDVAAATNGRFIVGTAAPWPHPMISHCGQIHTSQQALRRGTAHIEQQKQRLLELLKTEKAS